MNKALAVAAAWILIFSGIIFVHQLTLTTGEVVLLETQPVDPRDLFRGDYVILNYQISNLNLNALEGDEAWSNNQKIHVELTSSGAHAVPIAVHKAPPQGLYITGTVKQVHQQQLSVEYGIETYFVPESQGLDLEREQNLDVQVAIRNGHAVIRDLYILGEKISFE